MSIVIMNIGLAIPQTEDEAAKGLTRFWTVSQAEDALYNAMAPLGFQLLRQSLVQSDSEPTLVAIFQISNDANKADMRIASFALSTALEQDAVAYIAFGQGELVGPRAHLWGGKFKHEYFCYPQGSC